MYLAIVTVYGILVWTYWLAGKLTYFGFDKALACSKLLDVNNNRDCRLFESVYNGLLSKYHSYISDSRLKELSIRNLKVIEISTIQLFSDILRGVGRNRLNGARKKCSFNVYSGQCDPSFWDIAPPYNVSDISKSVMTG